MNCARFWPMLALVPALFGGDGLPPRKSAEEYPVHAAAGRHTIAAEFQYRTAVRERQSFTLREGLVVEVALFGSSGEKVPVSAGRFSLRINGKGKVLSPESPGMAISRDKWGTNPALVAGYNDSQVIIGGTEPGGRFPGDPRTREPAGGVPRVEDPMKPPVAEVDPVDLLASAVLPEGERDLPLAGLLYFHYAGKMKKIKRLELFYQAPGGEVATLILK